MCDTKNKKTTQAYGCMNVVDRIMPYPLKDVHILIPRTFEYITLHSKRNSESVIKLRILRSHDYPGLSGWAQIITRAL